MVTTQADRPDLWEFWAQTKREMAAVPLEPQVEPATDFLAVHIVVYRVSFASLGGVRLNAHYAHPLRDGDERFPGLLTFPGYGGGLPAPVEQAARGYAVLALDPRGQGMNKEVCPMERGRLTHHPEDLGNCGLRLTIADALRGFDFLQSRPEVDGDRLAVMGVSDGGALTLACAAIDDRPLAAAAHAPFMCNLVWAAENVSTQPFAEAGEYLKQHPASRDAVLANYRYFDPRELVVKLTCPIIVSVGLMDEVCPPSTIVPTFERIPGVKALVTYPDLVHAHRQDFHLHAWDWLGRYLKP